MRHDAITATRRYLNIALGHLPLEDAPTIAGIGAAKEAAGKAFKLLDASHKLLEAGIYTVMEEPPALPEIPEPGPRLFKGDEPAPGAEVKEEVPQGAKAFDFLLDEFLDRYWPSDAVERDPALAAQRAAADDEWTARFKAEPAEASARLMEDFTEQLAIPDFENTALVDLQEAYFAHVGRLRRLLDALGYEPAEVAETVESWNQGWSHDTELSARRDAFEQLVVTIGVELEALDLQERMGWEAAAPGEEAATEPGDNVEPLRPLLDLVVPGTPVEPGKEVGDDA